MITIDVTVQILELDGMTPVSNEDEKKLVKCADGSVVKAPLMVRDILETALLGRVQGKPLEGGEQIDRFILALQIRRNDTVELNAKQVVKLGELTAVICAPLVTAQILMILDGKDPWQT